MDGAGAMQPAPEKRHDMPPPYEIKEYEHGIVGVSSQMRRLFDYLDVLASRPTSVLLYGETGTGKELFARALHHNGSRKGGRFVAVNCGGIPSELLESELFGYRRGAFTDARWNRDGKFLAANGGTIFFDEIGDMPLYMQAKILRAIEEGGITPIGRNEPIETDVRIVAATNKDLETEVEKGRFREDLFYRLNVFPLQIPPLRERREDVEPLIEHFVGKFNEAYHANVAGVTPEALAWLREYELPGNARELRNMIERGFVLKQGGLLGIEDIKVNSEAARRAGMPSIFRSPYKKSPISFAGTEAEENRWYEGGVLPMLISAVVRLPGAKSLKTLHRLLEGKAFHHETFRKHHLVYLTPANAALLFHGRTEEFEEILKRIRNSRFTEIAGRPFRIYTVTTLLQEPEVQGISEGAVYGFIDFRGDGYAIDGDRTCRIFVVTQEDTPKLLGLKRKRGCYGIDGNRMEEMEDSFNRRLEEYWRENFISWRPGYRAEHAVV
ncbi:MAG: sigma-54-dependent Fis family transcriptional regulator [Candidatus Aenigmarchaeota archaeon]|nr:sigma-54-dependent Fis family transcriptional regulator [Candidatus Aenigmarchaeota archaeon]